MAELTSWGWYIESKAVSKMVSALALAIWLVMLGVFVTCELDRHLLALSVAGSWIVGWPVLYETSRTLYWLGSDYPTMKMEGAVGG